MLSDDRREESPKASSFCSLVTIPGDQIESIDSQALVYPCFEQSRLAVNLDNGGITIRVHIHPVLALGFYHYYIIG